MRDDAALRRLLLDLCFGAGPWPALDDADWAALSRMAGQHRLQPLLHHRMAGHDVPTTVRTAWLNAHRRSAQRVLMMEAVLRDVQGLLDAVGVRHAFLKGAWLARNVWPHPALRPMRDIDVLVDRDQLLTAWDALLAAGFTRVDGGAIDLDFARREMKHLPVLLSPRDGVSVELHERLIGDAPDPAIDAAIGTTAELLGRAVQAEGRPVLCAEDTAVQIIVHCAHEHQFNNGPLVLGDLAGLLDWPGLDWTRVTAVLEKGGWSRGGAILFALLARLQGEAAFPPSVRALAQAAPDAMVDMAVQLLLQNATQRDGIRLHAELVDAQGSRVTRLLRRAVPQRHALVMIGGHTRWPWLGYPRWLWTGLTRWRRAGASSSAQEDGLRTRAMRRWLEGGD